MNSKKTQSIDENRTVRKAIHLTPEEDATVAKAAQAQSLPWSVYARRCMVLQARKDAGEET